MEQGELYLVTSPFHQYDEFIGVFSSFDKVKEFLRKEYKSYENNHLWKEEVLEMDTIRISWIVDYKKDAYKRSFYISKLKVNEGV